MSQPFTFTSFGGLRLDQGLDEVGAEYAIFTRDTDWDGSTGKVRSRDGFQKLKSAEATGTYKALFPHSSARLLATKRIKESECKICAIDKEGEEKVTATWPSSEARACFTRYGTPTVSATYCRANTTSAKVVKFNGTEFTEPTAKVGGESSKEMPRGNFMVAWPDGGSRLVVANTGSEGGPNKLASSNSHVWFSMPGSAEEYETTAYVQLSPGDGEEITAMAVYGGQVFVFKETRFWVFYSVSTDSEGKPVFNFQEVALGEGSRVKKPSLSTLAESSDQLAASSPDGVYFCTTDGVWLTTGGPPAKLTDALIPLEESTPFDGPMAEFLNGSTETFRWPASGIVTLGRRVIVKRYEFMMVYDRPTNAWTCWKMPAVSLAVWTGLTGGGAEVQAEKLPGTAEDQEGVGGVAWSNINNIKTKDEEWASAKNSTGGVSTHSHYAKATNFGFSIPTGAIVVGAQIAVSHRGTLQGSATPPYVYSLQELEVKLVKAGTIEGTNLATGATWNVGNAEFEKTEYGGPDKLGGLTFTPAQVNASNFGCAVAVNLNVTTAGLIVVAQIDWIAMAVYYLAENAASGVRPRLFCTQSKSLWVTHPSAEEQAATREPIWQSGFYDLGSADEKTVRECDVWGTGDVEVSVAKNFGKVGEATTFELGETLPERRQLNKTQEGSMFSHRFSGEGPWSVQRITRYAQIEAEAGKQSK